MFRFPRIRVRPTAAGGVYLALVAGVTFGAVNTGSNLIYLVLALLLAVLLVSNVLAEWNLRGLQVRRRLPAELFAGVDAEGGYILHNPRRRGAAWTVDVEEVGAVRGRGTALHCAPGATIEAPAVFRFPERGLAQLQELRIGSAFPFGLLHRAWLVDVPAEVLVYPTPRRGVSGATPSGYGADAPLAQIRADSGEFAGLRAYDAGDPVRRVHWPTSARVGRPMVVLRTGEVGEEVVVRVDGVGVAREEQIARATGQVEWHCGRGDAVGLVVDGVVEAPRTGATWRRHLLTRLALLPRRS